MFNQSRERLPTSIIVKTLAMFWVLTVVGGIVGSWIVWALGVSPEAGLVAVTGIAFVGAAILIGVQRTMWPTTA